MSAVTALGTANPSANPTTSLSITTAVQIPAGAKVIISASVLATTPFVTATVGGISAAAAYMSLRALPIGHWTFYLDVFTAIEAGAVITVTFGGTSGAGGTMNAVYVTGLQNGPPETIGSSSGATNAVSSGATGTPNATPDYFAYASYAYASATAGTTTGNAYAALAEVIQATRVIKQEEAWKDFTHPVAAQTETWTDTAVNAQWAGGIALWKQGVFADPLLASESIDVIYLRGNV